MKENNMQLNLFYHAEKQAPKTPVKTTAKNSNKIPFVLDGLMSVCEATTRPIETPINAYLEVSEMGSYCQETFAVLTLNTKNKLIQKHIISIGLIDSTPVHPREIFKQAILDNAKSIILVHNHPSGDPSPSSQDLKITRRMIDAGRLLDMPVRDHLIVGREFVEPPCFVSLREQGLIDFEN